MPTFTVTGEIDPFLHVSLQKGEKIFCESGAMVMMEAALQVKGQLRGGLGRALLRRMATDESLFQQEIEAVSGDGDCLLSPTLPGSIELLDVGPGDAYTLSDGSFVAADSSVEVRARMNTVGGGLFGGTGGFVIMEATGRGKLAVSGFGSIFTLDIAPDRETVIDNNHAVAWSSNLQYEVGMPQTGGGFFGNIVNSVTSGEGLVLRFRGQGKVVICSRNRGLFQPQAH
ncbi:TIGR00266 family protein [Thiocystis violascens]|uniref:TIGR00266 family protein n=1 Tax=Thiocystis violascens (strain ATCC 17096 / DSM 198 / 6111) TaxID=765911 RepID=I3YAU7_THIV6|nr:TIGR00266 family protein [Thiocystis violascens]AFL74115.1 TIGR00266 family protein [Thiocystis violascens DSM 198]